MNCLFHNCGQPIEIIKSIFGILIFGFPIWYMGYLVFRVLLGIDKCTKR